MASGTWTSVATSGVWSTASNWASNVVADGATFTANFTSNITATTTIDTTIGGGWSGTVGNIVFSDNGANGSAWTLGSQSTITLTGGTPTITTTTSATINGILAGVNGLTKAGGQTLTLAGVNTFGGSLLISAGTLSATNASALGADTARALTILNGAALSLGVATTRSSFSTSIAGTGVSGTGAIVISNAGTNNLGVITLTANADIRSTVTGATLASSIANGGSLLTVSMPTASSAFTLSGQITGIGGLTLSASNTDRTLNLTNTTSNFSGPVSITGKVVGTLIADEGVASSLGAGTGSNGTIRLGLGSTVGELSYAGTGTLSTNRALDFAGTTGTASVALTTSGGRLTFTATTFTATGAGSKAFNIFAGGGCFITVQSIIPDSSGGETRITNSNAGGTTTLSGLNTFTGTVTWGNGTLSFNSIANVGGGASALGAPTTIANGTIALGSAASSGTLTYTGTGHSTDRVINLAGTTGGATITANGSGALSFTNPAGLTALGVGTKTLTLGGTNTNANTFAGAISDSSGGATLLTKSGVGYWRITGLSTFTGAVSVSAGTLATGTSATALGSDASSVTVSSGATLSLGVATNYATRTLSITGTGAGTLGALVIDNTGINSFASVSTLTANTYIRATGAGTGTFSNSIANGGFALQIGSASGSTLSLTGGISGTGGVTAGPQSAQDSSGIVFLSGPKTFTGAFTLTSGTVQIDSAGSLGGATATLALNGGTLSSSSVSGYTLTNAGSSTIGGNVTLGDATNTGALIFINAFSLSAGTRTLTIASPVTLNGIVSSGGIVKSGGSTLTLSGTNTYATASTLSAGTLILGNNAALGTAAWTIGAGTTLDVTATRAINNSLTLNSFTFTGTANLTQSTGAVTLNTATITVSGSVLQFNGNVTGASASLTKEGMGQLTLAGTNTGWGTTSGDIAVNAGVLRAAGTTSALGANTAGRTFAVASNATLSLGAAYTLGNISLSLAGAGAGGTNDAALLTSASLTFGGITLTAAATTRASSSATITAPIALAGFAPTFLVTTAQTLTLPGTISDTGTATVSFGHSANTYAGTFDLTSGANTFPGQVRVLSGTLSVATLANSGSNSSIGTGAAASTIQLGSGTNSVTFSYNSTTTEAITNRAIELMGTTGAVRINGGTSLGTLTLASNLVVTGVGAKTITLGNLGTFSGNIANGVGSVISLAFAASSVWTIAGTNTYTGGTTIAASATVVATNTQALGGGNTTLNAATSTLQSDTAGGQNGKLTIAGNLTNTAGGIIKIGGTLSIDAANAFTEAPTTDFSSTPFPVVLDSGLITGPGTYAVIYSPVPLTNYAGVSSVTWSGAPAGTATSLTPTGNGTYIDIGGTKYYAVVVRVV